VPIFAERDNMLIKPVLQRRIWAQTRLFDEKWPILLPLEWTILLKVN
jgi:hypothetical protein